MWPPALLALLLLLLQHSKSDKRNGPHAAKEPAVSWKEADSTCKNLNCFADYIQTLTCTWETGSAGRRPHNLTARWVCGSHKGTCVFRPTLRDASRRVRYACSSKQKGCMSGSSFIVTATFAEGPLPGGQRCGPFKYHENVKPQPPSNVTAVACAGGFNVSWEGGYPAYDYLHGELQYQLRYRQKGHPWRLEGGAAGDTPTLWLLPQELAEGAEYELQVRSGLRDGSPYRGTWSDWSPSSRLQTPHRGTTGAAWLLLLLLIITLLAFLGRHQSCRPWKKLEKFIPSPAPFFQTLYLVHNGDFQKWVGTSYSGAPLDVSECSTALPEVFKVSPKPLLAQDAPQEDPALPCAEALPAFLGEGPESALEPAYGHLSIDTVTVADACGPEPEAYQRLPVDGGHTDRLLPYSQGPPPPPWGQDPFLEPLSALCGGPRAASSPPPAEPFCRGRLSPTWGADLALDLDTVDSGFVDSDCGSPPGDCECQRGFASCAAPGEEEGAAFLPSYVKQWVACDTPPEGHS